MADAPLTLDDDLAVKARLAWMVRIDDTPKRSPERADVVRAAMAALNLSKGSVYDWYKRYCKHGEKGLRKQERRDKGRRRAISDADAEAWIAYATAAQRQSVRLVDRIRNYRQMLRAAHGRELECSDAVLKRVVDEYLKENPLAVMTAKEAKRTFKRQLRMGEELPNVVWQWDQHTADVEVFDPDTGEVYRPIGLWLVDRCSGVMLGGRYFRRYDTDAVEAALLDAIYPSADGACPYHGTPELIHGDNGKQFTSKWAKHVLSRLAIELATGQPCEPTGHGYIEGWHGIVGGFERQCPRYVGSDNREGHRPLAQRMEREGERVPQWAERWTLEQLNGEFRLWVARRMQMPYRGGASRDARFWSLVTAERRVVPDPADLAWEFMRQREVTVRGGAFEILGIPYTAEHLGAYNGHKLEARFLPGDMSRVWVANPYGEFLAVAHPRPEFAYHSQASYRELEKRNREFGVVKRAAQESLELLRASAELTGVAQAEADEAAATLERVRKHLRPEHREQAESAGEGAEVIQLPVQRTVETKRIERDALPTPSVAIEDLAGETVPRRRADQSEWI